MSFIYTDKKLALLLAGVGAGSIIKHSQDLGDWQTRWQVGSYLAQSLKSQLFSPVSTESGITNQAQAKISDLDNLDTFAKWLADNKITWSGQRLAWRAGDPRPEEALEVAVPDFENPDVVHQPEVFVSKPELIKYLQYLRDNQAVNNKALQVKLNIIINDVNKQLIGKTEKPLSAKPEAATTTSTPPAGAGSGAGAGAKPGSGSGAGAPPGTGSGAGAGGLASPDQVQRVLESLPLSMEDIDFRRIQAFFASYGPLSTSATPYINQAMAGMNDILNGSGVNGPLVQNKMQTFSLYAGPSQVATWLAPPAGSNYLPFISALEKLLNNVSLVLKDLYYQYGNKLKGDGLTRLKGQIEGPSSIWQGNWEAIETWKARGVSIVNTRK